MNIRKQNVFIYVVIFLAVLLQYGFHNILNLGFVTDDWFALRVYHFSESPKNLANLVKYTTDYYQGANSFVRPYSATIIPIQLLLFGTRLYLYSVVTFIFMFLSSVFFYLNLRQVLNSAKLALIIVLIFISFPNHPTNYYWFATQVSVFSLLLMQLSWYLISGNARAQNMFWAGFLFFLAIVNYENTISFLFLLFFVLLYRHGFTKSSLLKEVFPRLGVFFMSILGYMVYRHILIAPLINTTATKSLTLSHLNFDNLNHLYKVTVSNLIGYEFFNFIRNQLLYLDNLGGYFAYVPVMLIFAGITLYLVYKALAKTIYFDVRQNRAEVAAQPNLLYLPTPKKYLLYFGGIGMFATGIIAIFFAKYFYVIVGMGTRINLIPTVGLSIFIGLLFFENLTRRKVFVFLSIFAFFSLMNVITLGSFIKSYRVQQDFLQYIDTQDVPDNTLIVLDTNAQKVNRISAVETIWGISDLISIRTNNEFIEYIGNSSSAEEKDIDPKFYKSRRNWEYTYVDANIKYLEFYHPDL